MNTFVKGFDISQAVPYDKYLSEHCIGHITSNATLGFDDPIILECWKEYFSTTQNLSISQMNHLKDWILEKVNLALDYFNITQIDTLNKMALAQGLTTIEVYKFYYLYSEIIEHKQKLSHWQCLARTWWDRNYSDYGPVKPKIDISTYQEKLAFIVDDIVFPYISKLHAIVFPETGQHFNYAGLKNDATFASRI